jgi:hypothetical protein
MNGGETTLGATEDSNQGRGSSSTDPRDNKLSNQATVQKAEAQPGGGRVAARWMADDQNMASRVTDVHRKEPRSQDQSAALKIGGSDHD